MVGRRIVASDIVDVNVRSWFDRGSSDADGRPVFDNLFARRDGAPSDFVSKAEVLAEKETNPVYKDGCPSGKRRRCDEYIVGRA